MRSQTYYKATEMTMTVQRKSPGKPCTSAGR